MLVKLITLIVILIILYLLAIMPKLRKNPYISNLDGWYYAHRGLHNNKSGIPENSLPAFKSAVENHFGIELDVQQTRDKKLIVLHDFNLHRPCGVDKKVSETTYEELQNYHLFKSKEKIPTFEEALSEIGGRVPVIIELKIPKKAGSTCKAVSRQLKKYHGIYCIESFNPFGLIWYRKHYPKVVRGQLSSDFIKDKEEGSKIQFFILKHLLFNFATKPDFIAYHHIYKKELSFTLCRKLFGTTAVAWTIKSKEDLNNCRKFFNLFIFDSFIPDK